MLDIENQNNKTAEKLLVSPDPIATLVTDNNVTDREAAVSQAPVNNLNPPPLSPKSKQEQLLSWRAPDEQNSKLIDEGKEND